MNHESEKDDTTIPDLLAGELGDRVTDLMTTHMDALQATLSELPEHVGSPGLISTAVFGSRVLVVGSVSNIDLVHASLSMLRMVGEAAIRVTPEPLGNEEPHMVGLAVIASRLKHLEHTADITATQH